MRYISEFKIGQDVVLIDKSLDRRIEYQKKASASDLGNLIAKHIGFESNQNDVELKHTLEVQVFAEKDWRHFKKQLKEYIEAAEKTGLATFNLIVIGKMLKELERIGSPIEQKLETPNE